MKKSIVLKICSILEKTYPKAVCTLDYNTPIQLMIAARLSAQCTDARVNLVTPALFKKYKNIEDFANANPEDIEKYIYSCGFYKTKAQEIIGMCKMILNDFVGIVPDNLEDLTILPGIGRKTANLILGEIFGQPAIIVDTHFMRVTRRLGFHNLKNPEKIETLMKNILPKEESLEFCHRIVAHGRTICKAKTPNCGICPLFEVCKKNI